MLIKNADILKCLGTNVKNARKSKGYTQDYVAENINISADLLRNIENGRNIGSLPTILNLCNFLEITPNYLFFDLLDKKNSIFDDTLKDYFSSIPRESKETIKKIIIHIDKNYVTEKQKRRGKKKKVEKQEEINEKENTKKKNTSNKTKK